MKMRPFGHLAPVATARRRLLAAIRPVSGSESIPLLDAYGRVAAATYRAGAAVPPFARAAWDGYALRSADTRSARPSRPVRLRVIGEVYAEESPGRPLRSGEAVAIATGGAIPGGADAVEVFEEVAEGDRFIDVREPVSRGDHVAEVGEDFRRGATVVRRGEFLTPAAIGGLAAVGERSVKGFRQPRVGIVPNGNELLAPEDPAAPRKIRESNNLTLAAVVRAAGCVPIPYHPTRDDPDLIERAVRRAMASADLVLVTGGSSVGEHDYLPAVLPRIGRLLFHGIAVRPGMPTLAVNARGTAVVGMPGHPTSCLANGFWLLLPALRKLAHLPGPGWFDGVARLRHPVDVPTAGLSTIVPLRVENGWGTPTFHHSSAITSLSGTNAFALLPPRAVHLRSGSRVRAHFLPPPLAVPPIPPIDS